MHLGLPGKKDDDIIMSLTNFGAFSGGEANPRHGLHLALLDYVFASPPLQLRSDSLDPSPSASGG